MADVEDELLAGTGRMARAMSSATIQLMQAMERRKEAQARREASGYRAAADALAQVDMGHRQMMRAVVAPALDPKWRGTASDRELATAFVYAEAYSRHDEMAHTVHAQLRDHIRERHGDVTGFIDAHVTSEQIERVPVPANADLTPSQARVVAAREETAERWANVLQAAGERAASTWLVENLDEREKARLRAADLEDDAAVERDDAADARGRGNDPSVSDEQREAEERSADEHDESAVSKDEEADIERAGHGVHKHDPAIVVDPEALDAARIAHGGREQDVREQLAAHRNRRTKARHKARGTGQERERGRGLSR